jgi:hypothetical protein
MKLEKMAKQTKKMCILDKARRSSPHQKPWNRKKNQNIYELTFASERGTQLTVGLFGD